MDLNAIKEKLNKIQQASAPKQKREKIDWSEISWKPKVGKHQIRIVPSVLNKEYPFKEVYFHYGFAKFPILALNNWSEKDPIIEFAKQLRKSEDKEDWKLASKIEPKMRIFVPVVVRGEEEKGTRLWEFGKEIYSQLLGIADDPDYGDYTDINEGRDFTVEGVAAEVAGRQGIKCSIRIKPKPTPITNDPELLNKILNNQPDILKINKKHTFEELKSILQKWLNPEVENSSEDEDENNVPWSEKDSNKTATSNKFEALFPEESK